MSELNIYRIIVAILAIVILFVAGRPYFSPLSRILLSASVAGVLAGIFGSALVGGPLSQVPLRFATAFVVVGVGVAILEFLFPTGGRRARVSR
jgi:hypothetical protein